MKYLTGLFAMLTAALGGCGSAPSEDKAIDLAHKNTPSYPAVLTNASAETTVVLETAISQALNGTRVLLARDVFTKNFVLVLERDAQSSATLGLNGRMMDRPETHKFSLSIRNGQCYLQHGDQGREYALNGVECRRYITQ